MKLIRIYLQPAKVSFIDRVRILERLSSVNKNLTIPAKINKILKISKKKLRLTFQKMVSSTRYTNSDQYKCTQKQMKQIFQLSCTETTHLSIETNANQNSVILTFTD